MIKKLLQLKQGMTAAINLMLMIAVALLVIDVVWGVFTRFVMGEQAKWTEELARFLLIWIALLGSAVAFGTRGHLGVDFFVGKFDPEAQKLMAVVANLIVLLFAITVFLYGGCRVVSDALAMEQTTPALGWKMGYVYLALPISGFFMTIYTIENIIETIIAPSTQKESSK
jgi:TRAP-type C4-dicarboxylate transport system permease small subunit